jgi:hypothetical protein
MTPDGSAMREDAARRLVDAEAMLDVAGTLLDIDDRYSSAGVAAELAKLAGLAAADAACAGVLGVVAPVGDAAATIELVGTVEPHGEELAAGLSRLQEGQADAGDLASVARNMIATCRHVLAGTDSAIG